MSSNTWCPADVSSFLTLRPSLHRNTHIVFESEKTHFKALGRLVCNDNICDFRQNFRRKISSSTSYANGKWGGAPLNYFSCRS